MSKSRLTKALAVINKKLKWTDNKSVGYVGPDRRDKYLNPLLTPPPRSPRSVDDFSHPQRLGHWRSLGFDYTNPVADRYIFHEKFGSLIIITCVSVFIWWYMPDYKGREWARREAFLRTHKREALGLPLIDRNLIDPERMVLPSEEELVGVNVTY